MIVDYLFMRFAFVIVRNAREGGRVVLILIKGSGVARRKKITFLEIICLLFASFLKTMTFLILSSPVFWLIFKIKILVRGFRLKTIDWRFY